jgi:cytochrome c-type biogenesis protein CcmH
MTGFVIIGVVLTLAAVLCVVRPLMRRQRGEERAIDGTRSNLAILRDQLAELQADLGTGAISHEQYTSARSELERRVLEEGADPLAGTSTTDRPGRSVPIAVAVLVPVAVLGMYSWIGEPAVMRVDAKGDAASLDRPVESGDIEKMVAGLAARLEKNPDDARGWMMLGRSYYVLQRMPEAAAAYAKAVEKIKDDADLFADYADALAMSQGRRIEGKALDLVRQSLKINPTQPKALAMAGTEAFYRKDYPAALAYWEKLLPLLPPESEMAKSVAGGIDEARQLGGVKTSSKPDSKEGSGSPPKKAAGSATAFLKGTVSLSPALQPKVKPTDTLFIVARAFNGPRVPLAVVRLTAADLPADFSLDDSLAMSPDLKLSGFNEVVITARVSKSGNAIPQAGDLQGISSPVKVGTQGIRLVIDTVVP